MRPAKSVLLGYLLLAGVAVAISPNDPYYASQQWPLHNPGIPDASIDVETAWDKITGNPNIKVGILDTYVASNHNDLTGRLSNPYGVGENPGTRIAGIIGAMTNNGIGIAGVDWASRLSVAYGVRTSPYYELQESIQDLRNAGCRIIHVGWRWQTPLGADSLLWHPLADAYRDGVLVIAANPVSIEEDESVWGPASYGPWILSVTSTRYDGDPVGDTRSLSFTDVAAPGGDGTIGVYSTEIANAYGSSAGTHLASAHVAGAASLLLGANSGLRNFDLEKVLERTARGWPVHDPKVGYGLIKVAPALAKVVSPNAVIHGSSPLTMIASDVERTFLVDPVEGVSAGWYKVDIYEAHASLTFNPPYLDAPWAWLSYTAPGYSYTNPNSCSPWMEESVTASSAELRTYFYWIRNDLHGEVKKWAPYNPTVFPQEYTVIGQQPAFHDINDIATSITGNGRGVSWADCDGDGYLDVFLADNFEDNKLFRNERGIFFLDTGANLGSSIGVGGVWGDYDNDGDPDLYVVTDDTTNKLFRNTNGALVDVTASSGAANVSGVCRGTAWVDFDRDGRLDLFVARRSASNVLLRNLGDLTFADVTSTSGDASFQSSAAYSGICFGDYDNDGDDDLYVGITNGANKLFRNDDGYFLDVTSSSGPIGDTSYATGVAWADYDNDGYLDLYVANLLYGPNRLYHNQGNGTFTDATSGPLGDTGPSVGVGWSDYDNDGDLDLYVVNDNEVADKLLRNDGGGTFVDATGITGLAEAATGSGIAWGDLNNDGWQDLFLSKGTGATHKVLRNDMVNTVVENRWLRVKLEGLVSNRSAIGARVRAIVDGSSQMREVSGGSGFVSQNELTVAFGFGAGVTTVDTLEIRWPTGDYQRLTHVPTNTVQNVEECEGAHVVDGSMTAWAGSNPDSSFMTLHFALNTTLSPSQFEIQYRVYPSGGWVPLVCAGSGGECTLNGTSCARTASYYPCAYRKFEWRARALNCNAWQKWSQAKTFEAFCLEEL